MLQDLIFNSALFGLIISLLAYEIGLRIKRKLKIAIFNPLLIAIGLIIIFLVPSILIMKNIIEALNI